LLFPSVFSFPQLDNQCLQTIILNSFQTNTEKKKKNKKRRQEKGHRKLFSTPAHSPQGHPTDKEKKKKGIL